MNQVQLIGRVTKDLQLNFLPAGTAVLKFSLATNEKWKDKQTGQKQERVDFHNCVLYGKGAEIVNQYSAKGKRLQILGKLRHDSWDDKTTGQKKYSTSINVDSFEIIDFKENTQDQVAPPVNQGYLQTPAPATNTTPQPAQPQFMGPNGPETQPGQQPQTFQPLQNPTGIPNQQVAQPGRTPDQGVFAPANIPF